MGYLQKQCKSNNLLRPDPDGRSYKGIIYVYGYDSIGYRVPVCVTTSPKRRPELYKGYDLSVQIGQVAGQQDSCMIHKILDRKNRRKRYDKKYCEKRVGGRAGEAPQRREAAAF